MKVSGWLFDVYSNEQEGVTLLLIGEDGERHCLQHKFSVTFYAAGPSARLRALWQYLEGQEVPVRLSRTERRDLFIGQTTVLACEVIHPSALYGLFQQISRSFPDLTYYDADIHLALRYAAVFDVFPLARCEVEILGNQVQSICPLDTRWELDPLPAPLRILSLEPDVEPSHQTPKGIIFQYDRCRYQLSLEPARAVLVNLRTILERYNPDLILTSHGDAWLIPWLIDQAKELGLPLPLNRDPSREILTRKEHSYFSYGQIVYRGRQSQFFGRWHLDRHNTVLWNDYELEGVLEMARVTCLPVQEVARLSPGTGISSMQFVTALQQGILIPWRKVQAEKPKTALDLIHADMGGMVYQPTIGLHENVIGIDFVSMYPGIMVHFNISPEVPRANQALTPSTEEPGLIPQTLEPLLRKRIAYKSTLFEMPKWDSRRAKYKARSSAEKWLLVTCFGYLGYKNARFGRIESHEAVTEYGREALLRAKEAAEDLGYEILHLYVDGLWVKKATKPNQAEIKKLLEEIVDRTGLPIALDGIYRWVAFLPSRQNAKVPVANRYFGVFQDGSIKARGIECRRRDTPPFIAKTQMGILEILAQAQDASSLTDYLPSVKQYVKRQEQALREHRIPLEDLVLRQRLSRELGDYRTQSPVARAARHLASAGEGAKPGQFIPFLFLLNDTIPWKQANATSKNMLDVKRYEKLLFRAVENVTQFLYQNVFSSRLIH